MRSLWELFGALWSDDPAENDRPDVGLGAGYVPTLQADNTVKWALGGGGGEILVEDGAMEFLFDDLTGDVLYEG